MRAEPIKVTIARLAKYGYKSIEISGEPEQFGQNGSKDTKKLLDDHGLKCWGSVTLMLGERNLVAADPGQRAKSVQYTKDCITMVKELDGYEMTIVPATVGKIVFARFIASITTNGTGGTAVLVTLPFTGAAGYSGSQQAVGTARESGITGNQLQVTLGSSATAMAIWTYNNGYPGANGASLNGSIVYEMSV